MTPGIFVYKVHGHTCCFMPFGCALVVEVQFVQPLFIESVKFEKVLFNFTLRPCLYDSKKYV